MKKLKCVEFLDFGIFPGTILLSVGYSHEELIAYMDKKYELGKWKKDNGLDIWVHPVRGDKVFMESKFCAAKRELSHPEWGERTLYYIKLETFDFSDKDMTILAHECLHICQFHLSDILDRNKEHEAEAYLHTHIMRQCLERMRKKVTFASI